MPRAIEQLGRSADALRAEREQRLRMLVGHAVEGSAWHRRRLAGIDVSALTEDGLVEGRYHAVAGGGSGGPWAGPGKTRQCIALGGARP